MKKNNTHTHKNEAVKTCRSQEMDVLNHNNNSSFCFGFFFFLSKEQRNIHSCTTKVHDILCEIRCCVIWTSCKHHIKYLADLYAVMWCTCIDYVLNHHTPDNTIVLFTWDMRYMCCVWESAAFTIFSYIHHVPFSDQDF